MLTDEELQERLDREEDMHARIRAAHAELREHPALRPEWAEMLSDQTHVILLALELIKVVNDLQNQLDEQAETPVMMFGHSLHDVIIALTDVQEDVRQEGRDRAENLPTPGQRELAKVDASLMVQHVHRTRLMFEALAEKLEG